MCARRSARLPVALLGLAAGAAVLAGGCRDSRPVTVDPEPYVLEGTVLDSASRLPIENVRILLGALEESTDARGAYALVLGFSPVADDAVFRKPGYAERRVRFPDDAVADAVSRHRYRLDLDLAPEGGGDDTTTGGGPGVHCP